ncbi:hypothetical protein GOP47_0016950 [Adiantum capillus-veneris]|uniref:Uncharacterized protein n=1 Tax=Adiantum capillus-veneris TaxID=13818 RepID=A0A9D4ZCL4_ADICA|nr:hypothetical protein GOP47_0016950 [Adiantum capillus-veneris]
MLGRYAPDLHQSSRISASDVCQDIDKPHCAVLVFEKRVVFTLTLSYMSSIRGTITGNCVPIKQALVSNLPKSKLWLPKNERILFVKQGLQQKCQLLVQAKYSDGKGGGAGDFVTGFVLGGVVFGALGYLFAPQVNNLLSAVERELDSARKLPKGLDDDEGLEKTRRSLNEKIAQLNAAIDDVSAQLRADDKSGGQQAGGTTEFESAA